MNKELMPCPFCGSAPLVNIIEPHKHSWAEMPDHLGSCVIECGCGAGLIDDTQELVSNRWNTRSGSSGDPVQLEKAPEPVAWIERRFANGELVLEVVKLQKMPDDLRANLALHYDLEIVPLFTSPPEVAELQKQVQALQAEIEQLKGNK